MTASTRTRRTLSKRAPARGRAARGGQPEWGRIEDLYRPKFPSTELLAKTAKGFRAQHAMPNWEGQEGARARMTIAAGAVSIGYKNLARNEKTGERAVGHHLNATNDLARQLEREGKFADPPPPRQVITEWSRKSRSNMRRAFCEIDYEPFFRDHEMPAMVTLTYARDWEDLAPDGATSKRHLFMFRKRFERAWGVTRRKARRLRAIWKLEFQKRGAPHYHLMMVPPHGKAKRGKYAGMTFKSWLSHTWADIVGETDPERRADHIKAGTGIDYAEGLKATDPQRVATYFAKHGSFRAKEYQHNVPKLWQEPGAGPGRFWGYWNMSRVVHGVELHHQDATLAARTLRRWARSKGVTQQVTVPRYVGGKLRPAAKIVVGLTGAQELAANQPRLRSVRRPVKRMRGKFGAGWLATNNGPALASDISRYLTIAARDPVHDRSPSRSSPDRDGPAPAPTCEVCRGELAPSLANLGHHILCA